MYKYIYLKFTNIIFFARMRVRKEIIMSNIDEHSTNEELVEKEELQSVEATEGM